MKALNSGQSCHKHTATRFSTYENWQDVPVYVLREFADELRLRYTDRGVSTMVGLSAAAVQDFVKGRTQPERRTLRAFGELYLKFVPLAYEKMTSRERRTFPPLKSTLPGGEEAALEYVDAVFRAADASGTLQHPAEQLREWLKFLVQAEYEVEKQFAEHQRKRRPKGSGGEPPAKRSRKKQLSSDPE
ncbi:MAG TPA: hypothetical protein VFS20_03215 [Longimicrobium sp.]|nr:hypothetical protein [Longimicrobium sp.]